LLGPNSIEATATGYAARVSPTDVDSFRFEQLADEGGRLLATDASAAARVLRQGLALWRGMPWGELGDEPAIQPEAQRLRERRLSTIEDRISADLETGRATGVIGELEGLIDEYPMRERFRAQLMLALYRSGRQSDALRAFQSARQLLGEELGIEPSQELRDLEEKILMQDPTIASPISEVGVEDWSQARNPYKGLRAFRAEDSADFFGRSILVDTLVRRVEDDRFVAVVGASGSGKSSVVMAGLIQQLPAERWTVIQMVPGRDPFAAMRLAFREIDGTGSAPEEPRGDDLDLMRAVQAALPEGGHRLLLVIDQFEELLHQVADQGIRNRFIRNVAEAVEEPYAGLTVLVTMRADFFDKALSQPGLGDLIGRGMVGVLPLAAHELEAAAARPAERAGIYMEPELVAELVGDMTEQPGALPLFQYVLTELFEERSGPVLSRAAYRRLGGLNGALIRRAEDTYQTLDSDARALARQVFLRLVTVDSEADDSRRRVERASLEALDPSGNAVKAVLDAFDEARLLTFDRNPEAGAATVEVAHEALLREWPRMRGWLDAAREDLRLHGALVTEVAEWETSARDADYLLTGSRLDLYDDWKVTTTIELTASEKAFLAAGVQRREDEQAREEARRDEELRTERRSVRRLRSLVVVVSVAALVAAGLSLLAANRNSEAAASQREARARELANAAIVNAETDPELGMLLALEAIDSTRLIDGSVVREAEEALHVAVSGHRLVGSARGMWDVEFHSDGGLLVAGEPVRFIDPITGDVRFELSTPVGESEILAVAVSTDGMLIATGGESGQVVLWDGASGAQVHVLGSVVDDVVSVEFSGDGRLVAALAPGPRQIRVWDVVERRVVADANAAAADFHGPNEAIAFNPSGTLLAVTVEGEVWILDIASAEWISKLTGHNSLVTSVAFVADGGAVLAGSMDGTFRFWDPVSGAELASVDAGVGQIVTLDVSEDGRWLLTGGDGGAVRLWELQSSGARPVADLQGIRSMVVDVAFNSSATLGAAVDTDGVVRSWDITAVGGDEVASWPAEGPIAFSGDGKRLAVAGPDGRDVVIIETEDWETVLTLEEVVPYVGDDYPAHGSEWGLLEGVTFDPSGSLLATTTYGYEVVPGSATVWDSRSGDLIRVLVEHPLLRGSFVFSGDGIRGAVAACKEWESSAVVWHVGTGDPVFAVTGSAYGISVALDPKGELIAVQQTDVDSGPNVQVWNVDTGALVMEATHRAQWIGAANFNPAGDQLLTAGRDGSLRIWDVATGGLVALLEGHTGPVEGAGWSTDGGMIFSASLDGTARLWDAATGEMRLQLSGLDGFPYVSLSPDGRWLATSAGGVAKIWALDLDELVEIASDRLTRSLSPAECATYHFADCPP
jgi:WD40 repeat protein